MAEESRRHRDKQRYDLRRLRRKMLFQLVGILILTFVIGAVICTVLVDDLQNFLSQRYRVLIYAGGEKAAATLCVAAPEYAQQCVVNCPIHVTGNGAAMDATVADMAGGEGAQSMLMGCACATNAAGGGAIMNAQAEGVAIQTVLAMLA